MHRCGNIKPGRCATLPPCVDQVPGLGSLPPIYPIAQAVGSLFPVFAREIQWCSDDQFLSPFRRNRAGTAKAGSNRVVLGERRRAPAATRRGTAFRATLRVESLREFCVSQSCMVVQSYARDATSGWNDLGSAGDTPPESRRDRSRGAAARSRRASSSPVTSCIQRTCFRRSSPSPGRRCGRRCACSSPSRSSRSVAGSMAARG
jgi:hypothetical protein